MPWVYIVGNRDAPDNSGYYVTRDESWALEVAKNDALRYIREDYECVDCSRCDDCRDRFRCNLSEDDKGSCGVCLNCDREAIQEAYWDQRERQACEDLALAGMCELDGDTLFINYDYISWSEWLLWCNDLDQDPGEPDEEEDPNA